MSAERQAPAVYREVQRFSAPLFGVIWLGMAALSLVIDALAPADERPPTGFMPLLMLVILGGIWALFVLRTEVRGGTLRVRLWPMPALVLPLAEIGAVDVAEYQPLRDFGGWGWRFGRKGRIYSASGNRAVRIEAAGRGPIFIGSATPEALAAALRQGRPARTPRS